MNEDVEEYLRFLTIERGLSKNTIESYKRDISQYLTFIEENKLTEWVQIDRYVVLSFLQKLKENQKSAGTIIRMISCLRQFHQF